MTRTRTIPVRFGTDCFRQLALLSRAFIRHTRWRFPILLLSALLACTLPNLRAEPAPDSAIPITPEFLANLVTEAQSRHPGIKAATARQTASERAVDGVRTWEDPMVRFGGVVTSPMGPNLEMEGDLFYEAQQRLPLFGKAQAMRREAEAGAGVSAAEAIYRQQILRRAVAQAAGQLALADESLTIGTNDLALLQQMAAFARERQRAGLDSGLDLLRIENEHAKREQQLITDRQQRDFAQVSLNRLLARPKDSPWPTLVLPALAPEIRLTEKLFSMGLQFEPRLQVMRQEIAMADAGIEVARRARRPDVNVGIEGRQWSGSGDFREGMFTVGLNLPWFNRSKYRADLDRNRARSEAVRADVEDYELDVRQELFRVWSRIDASRREALLYQDSILPRSELAVSTALAAWTASRGMFLDVLEARRMLIEARLMRARAINEQFQMITELITCCGIAELDSLEMLTGPTPP
jgi:cobalt-zinc-cadmium efflux system outer membrane protein